MDIKCSVSIILDLSDSVFARSASDRAASASRPNPPSRGVDPPPLDIANAFP